ncbi:MAG TPA: YlzJ-like family protein [Desulfobacteria bacterium]|nr:YlzJ-like family protein [Desulfobacteria bacterium]
MAFWTPLDLEQVLKGWDQQHGERIEVVCENILLEVEPLGDGTGKIIRLISSDPNDYLRGDLAPGQVINIIGSSKGA